MQLIVSLVSCIGEPIKRSVGLLMVESNKPDAEYPCPCCGFLVFQDEPGSYDICPICFWEDDLSQLRFPKTTGANHVSLIEGQANYARAGVCELRFKDRVRAPDPAELREDGWRLLDPQTDRIEEPLPGVDSGLTYPEDLTRLYYWRVSYWLR